MARVSLLCSRREMAQRTDGPVKCGWTQNGQEKSPHSNQARFRPPPIMDSILDNIGNTPLVRINKIAKEEGLECELRTLSPNQSC